jgi:hypothetical protein
MMIQTHLSKSRHTSSKVYMLWDKIENRQEMGGSVQAGVAPVIGMCAHRVAIVWVLKRKRKIRRSLLECTFMIC